MRVDTDRIVNTNATALLQRGEAAIREGDSHFDLSNVQRCDSSAVALLLAWERAARERGVRLEFAGVPASLRSLAKLYGVDVLIPTDGTR
ncbi:MAG: STAS domain-containing protein [Burkholderiaceae bacterium]|nr:STAS domain-containing protein [Burkholderiaceae bacterium]